MKKKLVEIEDEASLSNGDHDSEHHYYIYRELDKQKSRYKLEEQV